MLQQDRNHSVCLDQVLSWMQAGHETYIQRRRPLSEKSDKMLQVSIRGYIFISHLPSVFYKHSQINHPVQLGVLRQASLVSVRLTSEVFFTSRKNWGIKREVLP